MPHRSGAQALYRADAQVALAKRMAAYRKSWGVEGDVSSSATQRQDAGPGRARRLPGLPGIQEGGV